MILSSLDLVSGTQEDDYKAGLERSGSSYMWYLDITTMTSARGLRRWVGFCLPCSFILRILILVIKGGKDQIGILEGLEDGDQSTWRWGCNVGRM